MATERDSNGAPLPGLAGILALGSDPEITRRLLETVIATMTEAVVVANAAGELLLHNAASLALHGYPEDATPEKLAGTTTVWEVRDLAGDPVPLAEWPLARALRGVRFTDYQLQVRRADTGKSFVGSYHGTPIWDNKGALRYALITIRDISRQQATEVALRERERTFQTMANSIPQLAWMTDATGGITWYNRRWYDYTGTTFEEVKGWGWQKLHHPDHVARVVDHIKSAFAAGQPWEDTFPLQSKEGNYRWFLSRALPIHDEQGRISRWFGTNTDITERLELEAALREREAQLRQLNENLEERVQARTEALARSGEALLEARNRFFTLFHTSPVPTVLSAADDGILLNANSAYLRFFGLQQAEVTGRTADEVSRQRGLAPASRERLRRLVQEQGRAANVEVRVKNGGGEVCTLLVSIETATLDGRPVAVTTLLDVTERKRAEERVRRLAAELSLAEERERRRVAQILHDDLQQMLVALQIQLQMAATGDPGAMPAALGHAGNFLDEIIQATRNLSVELGSPSLQSTQLDDSFTWIRRFMAEHYGLAVELEVDEDAAIPDPDVRAVIVRLVRELLFNVVKHAGVTTAHLSARLEAGALLIRVQDQGCGFDPTTLAGGTNSTGHGLQHMGERVRLLGGAFHLESTPGEGTRVTIAVPATG